MINYKEIIEQKYKDKLLKSLDLVINYYLFDQIIRFGNLKSTNLESFKEFKITEKLVEIYNRASKQLNGYFDESIQLTVEEIDQQISIWDNE